ncbi:MAG TPA: TrmH family RNA methyltransferase [Candidatus Saccharimonadales bacterium]|nr:TrmH family RNA methyltransferase [Candidatus Saccharimonadales bacterium]
MAQLSIRDHLCVVLVSTRNPLNMGAAARAMSNFGFRDLRVVNPYEAAFREARSAVGASELLSGAKEFKTVAEAVADCTLVVGTTAGGSRELQHPLKRLEQGASIMRKRMASGRVALLFGSEKRGLCNHDLSHCHFAMRIPARESHGSINLGQAVAICLYELVRDAKTVRVAEKQTPAAAAEVERFTMLLLDALQASGYLKPDAGAPSEEKIRRLVRRLNLPAGDAEVWLGMLRQIGWKIRDSPRRHNLT